MRKYIGAYCLLVAILLLPVVKTRAQDGVLQFILTSDVHYGITRPHFRGADSVSAVIVNEAMITAMNRLPQLALPDDGGIGAGKKINAIDGLMITGDIANRQEVGIQNAADSWQQFEADYLQKLTIKNANLQPTPLLICAGNHDVADALGYWKFDKPVDASSLAGMYNRMLLPVNPVTAANYNYATNKVHYSKNIGGIHLLFINLWPDSLEQQWIKQDLKSIKPGTPVLLFTHSMPDVEARFFTNPNGEHTINGTDRFENLLPEVFRDGTNVKDTALYEERGLAAFLKQHPEIKAYFHGHNNWNEYYEWEGPDNTLSLPCFRVDSPMKGRLSAKDEKQLSFQLISIDTHTKTMTVRECRWNTVPGDPSIIVWGDNMTMALR
ncbi:Ser/Thr phosphatase family protein [Russula earlei]|uniref:Ser/Thr phosphatase family protein n=1 Tax=Russula earlei TaxID=71964 RepID=A0ACC0TQC7_9AGAM|nr:Ser/Thr phosphatase family protein [Russula earlei]